MSAKLSKRPLAGIGADAWYSPTLALKILGVVHRLQGLVI